MSQRFYEAGNQEGFLDLTVGGVPAPCSCALIGARGFVLMREQGNGQHFAAHYRTLMGARRALNAAQSDVPSARIWERP